MSNIPKLRFPEFKGEWEEKKLSDIASFSKGKGYTKNDLVKNGTPIVLYGRMYTKYETVISDIDTFVNLQEGSIISKGGEIIVPASGETAEEISRASVVKNKGIILGGDLNIISLQKDKYNPEFFALTISSGTSQKCLSKLAQGKSVVHLHNEDLSGLQIKAPSLPEQQKIADFLSNVDSIITAETKILNTLQKKKKALMQKLFTLQLRFKSDDGKDFPAWEEKKLGDVCEISAGGDIDKENSQKIYSEQYPYAVYSNSLENKGLYGYANYFKIDGNTITVTGRGDVGHAIARHEKYVPIVRLLVCKPINNENVDFLENAINNTKIFIESTGVPQLTAPQLSNIFIKLPCIEEQQKIADCLSSIDSLIQTQQKVVTTWQQRKKALLQQMFV